MGLWRSKEPGVMGVSSGHSGITPGVRSEYSESCNEENSVAPSDASQSGSDHQPGDVASEAMAHLRKR